MNIIESDPTPTFRNPYEFDMLMQEPVHEMMMTGIRVDVKKLNELRAQKMGEWYKAQETLDTLAGWGPGKSVNVASPKHIPFLLYEQIGLPKKTKKDKYTGKVRVVADEEAIRLTMAECMSNLKQAKTVELRNKYKWGYATCAYILKSRGLRKALSSYLGIKFAKGKYKGLTSLTDSDGRLRGTVSVGGTETFRFSHSKTLWGTGVNLATIPGDFRAMCVADEGFEFAEFDLNRGESWIYAHLSEDPELLRIHVNGLDFHAETAATISTAFGTPLTVDWIIEHKKDEAYKIRFLGKKINHASSYRMGPYKGAESINNEADDTGITATPSEVTKAQKLWHEKYFCIKSKWWREIESTINETRTLVTPYGRVHEFHGFIGEDLLKSATAYVPQSTSVDYINRGFLRIYHRFQRKGAWGLRVLAQTHDSLLIMYRPEHRVECLNEVARAIESKLVIKRREFSIPVEASFGPYWGAKEGFKLSA